MQMLCAGYYGCRRPSEEGVGNGMSDYYFSLGLTHGNWGNWYVVPFKTELYMKIPTDTFISLGTQYMVKLGSIIRLCTI
jgi:hypothetical protein